MNRLKKGLSSVYYLDLTSNGLRSEEIEEFLEGGVGQHLVYLELKSTMG